MSPASKREAKPVARFYLIFSAAGLVAVALSYGVARMPFDTLRIWSWLATGLLAIHVGQRWRLTYSYFKPRRQRSEG